ncbi:type IV toxin-antitoxin system AbiEi family antitoxin domain-containing protein [Pontibacter harenae]|uniref:type IV toxin-antitoxin system AbiEi family antitoxin domain-containing protein n=1 Tax=Pontibacter harenae TaxID=2894083 RepID=UPI001E6488B0|nr:DUF6088 family protein [Pontibacter harenae]MCC9169016.1 DUF6088 family protein [Pontibacter harenae]
MSIMKQVRERIELAQPGQLLTYADFRVKDGQQEALAAALSRLTKQGIIDRLAKGRYYKPKETAFGKVKPTEKEIIKSLSTSKGKVKGYESGLGLYNQLGLTTQVPREVTLMTRKQRRTANVGKTKIRYVQSPTNFKESDIDKLQVLDALRGYKKIPDRNSEKTIIILLEYIKKLAEGDMDRLIELALDYNPATRALLGALLEQLGYAVEVDRLRQSLNPLTKYKLGISESILPNRKDWNII